MLWTLLNDSLHNIPSLFMCFPPPFAVSSLPLALFSHFLHLLLRTYLALNWHQRTHLCEAIRSQQGSISRAFRIMLSQHYTKDSRNTPLSWFRYGVGYSQHFL